MIIELDQSGKIEATSVDTVVAFSNHICKSILISAKDKREIQKIFREIGKPKMFVYRLFALLIFLLTKDSLREIGTIVIDQEYPGKERIIKHELLTLIRSRKRYFENESIVFRNIGKRHRAHITAIATLRGNRKADIRVTAQETLTYLL